MFCAFRSPVAGPHTAYAGWPGLLAPPAAPTRWGKPREERRNAHDVGGGTWVTYPHGAPALALEGFVTTNTTTTNLQH